MIMFSDGKWCRILNMEHGVQTSMQNLENPIYNFDMLSIIVRIG